jgi:hypothetical protein
MNILRPLSAIALSLLTAGCATAFEYPKAGQAWGQIVEETPGKPALAWNYQAACEALTPNLGGADHVFLAAIDG